MVTKIAHITDSHLDEEFPTRNGVETRKHFDSVLNDIKNENISEIICTGDIGEDQGLMYFFDQLKSYSLSITLGDHDKFSQISKYYTKGTHQEYQKIYSSIERDNHKYIYLDSSAGIIDKEQLYWFQTELISSKPILIFLHHPIIRLNTKADEIGRLKNRNEVLSIMENSQNKISIFCGHYHTESSIIYKNIEQYITPAVSFQIEELQNKIEINTKIFGYRIIEIENTSVTSQVKLLEL